MRETEACTVFEAVAEPAIQPDMGEPDQGDLERERGVERGRGEAKRDRRQRGVDCIVGGRAGAGAREIAEEAQVRRQQQKGEQPPRGAGMGVERCRRAGERQPLQPQQEFGAAGDAPRGSRCLFHRFRHRHPLRIRQKAS